MTMVGKFKEHKHTHANATMLLWHPYTINITTLPINITITNNRQKSDFKAVSSFLFTERTGCIVPVTWASVHY